MSHSEPILPFDENGNFYGYMGEVLVSTPYPLGQHEGLIPEGESASLIHRSFEGNEGSENSEDYAAIKVFLRQGQDDEFRDYWDITADDAEFHLDEIKLYEDASIIKNARKIDDRPFWVIASFMEENYSGGALAETRDVFNTLGRAQLELIERFALNSSEVEDFGIEVGELVNLPVPGQGFEELKDAHDLFEQMASSEEFIVDSSLTRATAYDRMTKEPIFRSKFGRDEFEFEVTEYAASIGIGPKGNDTYPFSAKIYNPSDTEFSFDDWMRETCELVTNSKHLLAESHQAQRDRNKEAFPAMLAKKFPDLLAEDRRLHVATDTDRLDRDLKRKQSEYLLKSSAAFLTQEAPKNVLRSMERKDRIRAFEISTHLSLRARLEMTKEKVAIRVSRRKDEDGLSL